MIPAPQETLIDRLDLFVAFQHHILEDSRPSRRPKRLSHPPASHSLGRLTRHLLVLGIELRAELPDPDFFLDTAAWTVIELAQLVFPNELNASRALGQLASHQRDRLRRVDWRAFPSEAHLARAYWQLSGFGLEILSERPGDGLLEEHASDFANYLLFAVHTSGAWDVVFNPAPVQASLNRTPPSRPRNPPRAVSEKGGRR